MWGIANAWSGALGDAARARVALTAATAETTQVRDLTAFATAWRSLFDDDAGVRGALARAEGLAATAEHWLDLAESYFDGGTDDRVAAWDPEGVRRALAAGLAAAPTDEQRAQLATGYRDWLGIGLDDPLEAALVWLAEVACDDDHAWPLLGLILTRARRAPDDPRLASLVAELVAAEAAVPHPEAEAGWLFRTTNFDAYHDLWRVLAAEALARLPAGAAHLLELRQLLTCGSPDRG